jgi:hypothetical protein
MSGGLDERRTLAPLRVPAVALVREQIHAALRGSRDQVEISVLVPVDEERIAVAVDPQQAASAFEPRRLRCELAAAFARNSPNVPLKLPATMSRLPSPS